MQTAQEITGFTSCNNPRVSGYQLTTLLIRNGKKLGLKSSELLVFMALASYWNGKPVYPKINTLSDDTTLSEKAVRTAINGLLTKGYIIKSKRGKNANVYNINVSLVISTIQTGKSDLSSAVEFTAPCNMKLYHDKSEQQHKKVVFINSVSGEDIPEILKQNKNIKNVKAYWTSLSPEVKAEYIKKQKQLDHKAQLKEKQKQETQRYIAEVTDFSKAVDPKTLDCWRLLGDKLKKNV